MAYARGRKYSDPRNETAQVRAITPSEPVAQVIREVADACAAPMVVPQPAQPATTRAAEPNKLFAGYVDSRGKVLQARVKAPQPRWVEPEPKLPLTDAQKAARKKARQDAAALKTAKEYLAQGDRLPYTWLDTGEPMEMTVWDIRQNPPVRPYTTTFLNIRRKGRGRTEYGYPISDTEARDYLAAKAKAATAEKAVSASNIEINPGRTGKDADK
jgi:hypothetical protein